MPPIDDLLGEAVRRGEVAAVAGFATGRDGVLFEGAQGPGMAPDSVLWIASLTKAVVSVAAMQMVEEGRLALDAPLGPLLPELADPQVLEGFDAAGAPVLRPARRPITLRHLLTHTAGFSYPTWNDNMRRYLEQVGVPTTGAGGRDALRQPLVFDPGERWEYGINVDWVGQAMEAASGRTLDDLLRERVLAPLGMADTGFVLDEAQRARVVPMHRRQADGSLAPMRHDPPAVRPAMPSAGGGLWSTAHDYGRFLRMLLNGGTLDGAQVLRAETVADMGRNHIGALDVPAMRSVLPDRSHHAEFFPGRPKCWGLGFLLNQEAVAGGRGADSLAWAGLANCYYWIDPAHGVAGLLMTQILPFADPVVLALLERFEQAVYAGRAAA